MVLGYYIWTAIASIVVLSGNTMAYQTDPEYATEKWLAPSGAIFQNSNLLSNLMCSSLCKDQVALEKGTDCSGNERDLMGP